MKRTFTFISLMLLSLFGVVSVANAADDVTMNMTLSAEKTSFTPGNDYLINVDVTNTILVKACQGDVVLPKGLTFVASESKATMIFDASSRIPRGQSLMDNQLDDSTARFIIVPVAMNRKNIYIEPGEGAVCTFKVHCTDSLAAKSVIKLVNVAFSDTLNGDEGMGPDHSALNVTNSRRYPDLLLSIGDVTVKPGTPTKLHVMLDNSSIYDKVGGDDPIVAFQFDMELPEGASLSEPTDDDYSSRLDRSHQLSVVNMHETIQYPTNTWRIVVSALPPAAINGNSGELFTLTLNATDELPDTSVIKVFHQVYCTGGTEASKYVDQKFTSENANVNAEFNVKVIRDNSTVTGITEIKKELKDDRVYNLAGQRVSPNTKGLVIINGKKVIRK